MYYEKMIVLLCDPKAQHKTTATSGSGARWVYSCEGRQLDLDQHLQQRCRVTNASRDGDKCIRNERMFFRQSVKAVAHAVELLNFIQDRVSTHGHPAFLRALGENHFRWLTWFG